MARGLGTAGSGTLSPSPQGRRPLEPCNRPSSPSLGCNPALARPPVPWRGRLQAEPSTSQGFKHTRHLHGLSFSSCAMGVGGNLSSLSVVCQALVTHTYRLGGGDFGFSHFTGEETEGWVAFPESHNQEWKSWSGLSCRPAPPQGEGLCCSPQKAVCCRAPACGPWAERRRKRWRLVAVRLLFRSRLCCFLAVRPWATYLTFPCPR